MELAQLLVAIGHISAFTSLMCAISERKPGYDITGMLDAGLRLSGLAGVRSGRDANAPQ